MLKTMESSTKTGAKTTRARGASTRGAFCARRRGQTLLIAVLLMIAAALLGVTFITVVALNLSQTTRGTNTSEAQAAATAGVRYVNDRIVNSIEGERWDPSFDQTPPAAGAEYDLYYTPFEQAQGWTNYAKYPDPRVATSSFRNSPTFLAQVKRIKIPTDPAPLDPESNERGGQLRLDIIGRSADNDAVFARRVAYKPTRENGGPGAFARYDFNYDFGGGRVIQTQATDTGTITIVNGEAIQEVPVSNTRGFSVGRTVTATVGGEVLAAVVRSVNVNATGNTLTLRFARTVPAVDAVTRGAVVRAASPLTGNIQTDKFDAVGAGYDPLTGNAVYAQGASTIETRQDAEGGIFINGGLALVNRIALLLRYDSASTLNSDSVQVAGVISRDDTAAPKDQTPSGITRVIDKNGTEPDALIPANGTGPTSDLQTLVRDNSAAEAGDPTANLIRPLTPGRIDAADSRYLKLTRGSGATGAQYGYGPGVYIDNADDVEKVGRLIGPAGSEAPDFRALTVSETQRLWTRKSFLAAPTTGENGNIVNGGRNNADGAYFQDTLTPTNNTAHRLSWPNPAATATPLPNTRKEYFPLLPPPTPSPAAPTPAPVSLEQRGMRGWVSPWEYKPRGVLIELRGNDIIITRDDRSDVNDNDATDPLLNGPNPAKAWKAADGTSIGNNKIYRMRLEIDPTNDPPTVRRFFGAAGNETAPTLPEPFNGVIYAEGNVRVRGYTGDADITIASMNNIYIEGSIKRRTPTSGFVALLAKNNVVLNPTRFIAAPNGVGDNGNALVSTLTDPAIAGATTLFVDNTANWKVGDLVRVANNGNALYTMLDVSTPSGAGILTLSSALTNPVAANTPNAVTLVADEKPSRLSDVPVGGSREYSQTLSNDDVLLRDIRFDGVAPSGNYRVALRHGATSTPAFTLRRNTTSPDGNVSLKANPNSNSLIEAGTGVTDTENKLILDNSTASTYDLLQIDGSGTRGDDTTQILTKLQGLVTPDPLADPPPPWTMTTTTTSGGLAARRVAAFQTTAAVDVGTTIITVPQTLSAVLRPYGIWNGSATVDVTPPTAGPLVRYLGGNFLGSTPRDEVRDTGINIPNNPNDADPLDLRFYQKSATDTSTAGSFWFSQGIGVQPDTDLGGNPVNHLPFVVQTENLTPLPMPNYGIGPVKLEANNAANNGNGFLDATTNYTPGMNIEVDAQIYAQNGSWFVIPMPALEPAVNKAELDADLTLTAAQKEAIYAASTRFRRQNYAITVNGTISQNFAPPLVDYDNEVDPDGVATGPQQRWIDSLAYPTQVNAAPLGGKYGAMWTTIQYIGQKLPPGNNLKMPISPDLLYVN